MRPSSPMRKSMPIGPKGEKRPADVIGNAVKVIAAAQLDFRRSQCFSVEVGEKYHENYRGCRLNNHPGAKFQAPYESHKVHPASTR